MVALVVPPEQAETFVVDDGLPADDLHITLAYLGHVDEVDNPPGTLSTLLDVVTAVAGQHAPVVGQVSGVGRFAAGQQDAFYLSYDSPGLDWLRGQLVAALSAAGLPVSMLHGFTAHITLAYLSSSDPAPRNRIDPVTVEFDALVVAWGQTRLTVPFGLDTGEAPEGLRPEEIADPRTWGELRAAQASSEQDAAAGGKSFFEESAHPRGAGGKFAAKPKPAGEGQVDPNELPPDWLDRTLAGDARFVKPKPGGGGKGKGKGGKGKGAAAARANARAARRERARAARDRELLVELKRRDAFEQAVDREVRAEDDRREAADARNAAIADPAKQAAAKAAETARRKKWTSTLAGIRRTEMTRRRQWELQRRQRAAQDAAAEARAQAADRLAQQQEQQQTATTATAAAVPAGKG
jgi:2'-5' RNA ligase